MTRCRICCGNGRVCCGICGGAGGAIQPDINGLQLRLVCSRCAGTGSVICLYCNGLGYKIQ
ncbi:hypothetical protein RhiirC2_732857 [Rhizophagus irregularis]|uniref:Uncharacterized protein n=1 Tax=Rhizophagus irregularis TaxID=588596 RepID=A0A2N1NT23_9GLOM|nr:hypothetical protein RhiirC2_740744 [Rhizophagus irregularis]PKK77035.1 hypothetical protein RhiirC2_732857 [Rhizophagus irregularis]